MTTDEIDRYSEKKLTSSAIINGRILTPMRSFWPHEAFSGSVAVCSLPSGEEPTIVYSISVRLLGACKPFVMFSLSSKA